MAEYSYVNKTDLEYVLIKIHNELKASRIAFDDTSTELGKTTVQGAIESLKTLIGEFDEELAEKVDKDGDKVLSDYNFSAAYKEILDNLATTLSAYMEKTGGTFTGPITLPAVAAETNDNTAATTAYVTSAIATALQGITGIKFDGPYESLDDLKAKVTNPDAGTIYLVTNPSGTLPNASDEYFWNTKTHEFELFGSTSVDLSGYVKRTDMVAITTAEIDQMLKNAGFDVVVTA